MSKVSLEDLVALNAEIASLIRAGVPLEIGFSDNVDRRLRGLTQRLSQRLTTGITLVEALDAEGDAIPQTYRAVVKTGLKTGRLPEALEELTDYTRSVSELRRELSLALLYPAIVLVLAYGMFLAFLYYLVPTLYSVYQDLRIPTGNSVTFLHWLKESIPWWVWLMPVALWILAVAMNITRHGLWSSAVGEQTLATCGGILGMAAVVANSNRANFAQLLALLIEHQVPLHEAVQLASESTGDRRIIAASRKIATDAQRGCSLTDSFATGSPFTPFMQWMMAQGERQSTLVVTLRQMTDIYRRRALFHADWMKSLLPIVFVLTIGGGATLLYGLSLFLPLAQLMRVMDMG